MRTRFILWLVAGAFSVSTQATVLRWSDVPVSSLWDTSSGDLNWRVYPDDPSVNVAYSESPTAPDVQFSDRNGTGAGDNGVPAGFKSASGTVEIGSAGVSPNSTRFNRGWSKTYTVTGGDILTGALYATSDSTYNFDRDGSYSFDGGAFIDAKTRFRPVSGGNVQFGTGTITLADITIEGLPDFAFQPGAAGTLTNNIVVNGSGTITGNANSTFGGQVTLDGTLDLGFQTGQTFTPDIALAGSSELRGVGYNTSNTPIINVAIDDGNGGNSYDLTLRGTGSNDLWRTHLAGVGGWKVGNVTLNNNAGHGTVVSANSGTFFGNITGKVMIQDGFITDGFAFGSFPASVSYDATVHYELQQSGSKLSSTVVNVTGGGTVSGIGQITGENAGSGNFGTTTVNVGTTGTPGTLSPGLSIGTLSVNGNLVLGPDGILDIELGAPGTSDLIAVAENLTLGGILNMTDAGGAAVGTYTIMTYGGSLIDNGLQVMTSDLFAGTIDTGNPNTVLLHVSAIPEPTSLALLGLCGLTLLKRRHRK